MAEFSVSTVNAEGREVMSGYAHARLAADMDFAFSPEQEELRRTVRQFLDKTSPETEVRRLMATERGYDADTWHRMADELGLLGMAIPEEYGGAGAGFTELGIVAQEMGRALFCGPFLGTAVLAAAALLESADDAAQRRWLPAIAAGELIATRGPPGNAGRRHGPPAWEVAARPAGGRAPMRRMAGAWTARPGSCWTATSPTSSWCPPRLARGRPCSRSAAPRRGWPGRCCPPSTRPASMRGCVSRPPRRP